MTGDTYDVVLPIAAKLYRNQAQLDSLIAHTLDSLPATLAARGLERDGDEHRVAYAFGKIVHAHEPAAVCREACDVVTCDECGADLVLVLLQVDVRPIDRGSLLEQGRRLASERDDLIARGVDPGELLVPLAPYQEEGDTDA